jgi:hypothetical protein
MGGKGLLAADVAPNLSDNGPRRFVYERMKSHLRDAAATAAEAWAAGMAEGLARYACGLGPFVLATVRLSCCDIASTEEI